MLWPRHMLLLHRLCCSCSCTPCVVHLRSWCSPRYGFYLASKLVLLLPGAPMFSTDYLRGPPVVAFEGVMLPLCCTVRGWGCTDHDHVLVGP